MSSAFPFLLVVVCTLSAAACRGTVHLHQLASQLKTMRGPSHVLTDVDGTLLTSTGQITEITMEAIRNCQAVGVPIIPCTGRTRRAMAMSTGPEFISIYGGDVSKIAGVYQQGLMVYGLDGQLIYEEFIDENAALLAMCLAKQKGISVLAFCGDLILCESRNVYTDSILAYKDPAPEVFDGRSLEHLWSAGIVPHKLLLVAEESDLCYARSDLAHALTGMASITKAVPGMLEILPFGSSKGKGVRKLLDHLNVPAEAVVALGDGENDIEMLELVGLGVAVANARPALLEVADATTHSNDESGVAAVLEAILARRYDRGV